MPPGVAAVVVEVLTGDADAKLKRLGDTAVAQSKAIEASFAKTGAVMSESMGAGASAIDVALLSNKKYQESLVQMERAKLQLWNTTLKTAADTKAAEDAVAESQRKVIAATREQEAAQRALNKEYGAKTVQAKAAADVAVREAQREVAAAEESRKAAERAARIIPAQRAQYENAVGGTIVAKAGASRRIEEQVAAQKRLEEATERQKKAMASLQSVGAKSMLVLGASAAVVGVEAIKMGKGFEDAQRKFEGFSGQGEQAGNALTSAFEGTAGKFMQSGQELEGAYAGVSRQVQITQGHVLSAGESLKFMSHASDLTTASGEKLENVTKDLASVMQVYKTGLGETSDVSNKLFNATRIVSSSVDSMTSLVTKLHARLGDIGGGLNSVLGLMSEAASFGLTGGRGVLIFNQALERLTSDSKATTQVLEGLNVHLHNSKGEFVGLPSVIEQLHGAYKKMTVAQREFTTQQLFGKGATGEFTEIIRNGRKGLEGFTDEVNKNNQVHRAAEKVLSTFTGELHRMAAAVKTAGGALGKELMPEAKDVANAMKTGAEWFGKNGGAALALAGVLVTGLGATMGAFVGGRIGAMLKGLKALGAAFGATAVEAKVAGAGMVASASTTEAGVVAAADGTEAGVDAALLGTGIGAILVAAGFAVLALKDHWKEAFQIMLEVTEKIVNSLEELIEGMLAPLKEVGSLLEGLTGINVGASGQLFERAEWGQQGPPKLTGKSYGEMILGGGHGATAKAETAQGGGIMGYFMQNAGLSPVAAAGIVGNWKQESSLNFQLHEKAKEGGWNIGIASWHDPKRQEELKKFAKEHGDNWTNPEVQMAFTLKELGPQGIKELNAQKSPRAAAEWFNKKFEVGSDPGGIREKYAEQVFKEHPQKLTEASGPGNSVIQGLLEEHKHGKAKKTTAALGIPAAVVTMVATAEHLLGAPYKWGGGHGASAHDPIELLRKIGVDCTGFVSKVLSSGGVPVSGFATKELASSPALAQGKGKYVTVYDRSTGAQSQEHAFIQIGNKYFEEGGKAASAAAKEITKKQAEAELAGGGFQAYHPKALNAPVKGGAKELGGNPALEAEAKAGEAAESAGTALFRKFEDAIQNGTVRSLDKLLGVTEKDPTGQHSVQFAQFAATDAGLRASGATDLANKLVIVHREALETLDHQLLATAEEKEAEVMKEQIKHFQNEISLQSTLADKGLEIRKDESTKNIDAVQTATQKLGDAANELRVKSDTALQALQDAAQVMTDEFSGRTTTIKDQSLLKVDELLERGKYGLELQAQREQVALDQMKLSYDTQLSQAKTALDQLKAQENTVVAAKQLHVAQVSTAENAVVAADQAAVDADRLHIDQVTLKLQEKVGQVQLHADDRTSKDLTRQVLATLKGASKTAQSELAATTKWDEEFGSQQVQGQTNALTGYERAGRAELQTAEEVLAGATAHAAEQVQLAQNQLQEAEAHSKEVIQKGQTGLEELQGRAEEQESESQRKIDQTKAESTTQYAGSGLVVNFTNIPPNDATAIQSELGFLMRHLLPA